jgi:hypothetical protein
VLLSARAVRSLQLDKKYCGGITRALRGDKKWMTLAGWFRDNSVGNGAAILSAGGESKGRREELGQARPSSFNGRGIFKPQAILDREQSCLSKRLKGVMHHLFVTGDSLGANRYLIVQ